MQTSFEHLPKLVEQLSQKVDDGLKNVLSFLENCNFKNDRLLTVEEAAEFLRLSVPTIYALNRQGELPVIKKGKRCYYFERDLLEYLRTGRRKSKHQIGDDVSKYLRSNKLI